MKKITYLVAPLMVLPFLVACNNGGGNTPDATYSITFKNEGEEDKKIENIKAGSLVTEGIPTPTKQPEDAEFIGWCTDTESKNVFDFSTIKIYQDYTLYSGWTSDAPLPEIHEFVIDSALVSKNFTFTDASGNKMNPDESYTMARNRDFVFYVTTINGTISPEYIIAFHGNDITTATSIRMDCELSESDTKAKFTIHKQDIVSDITLAGMEHKDGMYLFDFPYAYACSHVISVDCEGAEWDEGDWYGYAPLDKELKITLAGTPGSMPDIENVVFYKDGTTIDIPTTDGANGVKYEKLEEYGTAKVTLTINPQISGYEITDSLFVIARSKTSSILNLLSWQEIEDISNSSYAANFFMLGEEKTILINGHYHTVRIIGFDHDELSNENGTAGITFQFSNVISDAFGQMSGTIWDDYNYNFKNSTLNLSLSNVYDTFPISDLKDCIKKVKKSVNIYESSQWGVQTYDAYFFPLAVSEVDSTVKVASEGKQYAFFAKAQEDKKLPDALKIRAASGTSYVNYWLRSPTPNTSGEVVYAINTSGKVAQKDSVNHSYGMLPAFCI